MNISAEHQSLLDDFTDQLWLEEGLARNTLQSYRNDLAKLAEWLEKNLPQLVEKMVAAEIARIVGKRA